MPALGANQQFCRSCGQIISSLAPTCPHCGAPTGVRCAPANASPKSRLAALLLCFFFGLFGVHRFYVGKIGTGILQIITLGGLGIWTLVDFILIIVGSFRDAQGRPVIVWTD
jgi:TM2 domain-containing membrane protein YozV